MLTTKEIQDHLARVTYKPGWSFEAYDGKWEGQHIVIRTSVPNAYNTKENTDLDVHSMLPPIPDTNYLNSWLMWRVARLEVHEVREFFKVDGKIVDDPHAPFANEDRM